MATRWFVMKYRQVICRRLALALLLGIVQPVQAQVELAATELPLNEWVELRTPSKPLPAKGQPKGLIPITGKTNHPYVSLYRVRLSKGARYTFEVGYPADHKGASLCLRGFNPLAHHASANTPSGTSYIGVCLHRGFPGGDIKGRLFGKRETLTISPKSESEWGWLSYHSKHADVPMRLKIHDPAITDEELKQKGSWQKLPDGREWANPKKPRKTHWWLGYAYKEPKLPHTFEVTAVPGSLAGIWYGPWGTFTLGQVGDSINGGYDTDRGEIEGVVRDGVLEGYWSETHSSTKCASKRGERAYWGRIRLKREGKRLTGLWAYCDEEPSRTVYADLRESRPVTGDASAAQAVESPVTSASTQPPGSDAEAASAAGSGASFITPFKLVDQEVRGCAEFENERLCRARCEHKSPCAQAAGGCSRLCAILFDDDPQPVVLGADAAASAGQVAVESTGSFAPFEE